MTQEILMLYEECKNHVGCVGCPAERSSLRIGDSYVRCSQMKIFEKENEETVDKPGKE